MRKIIVFFMINMMVCSNVFAECFKSTLDDQESVAVTIYNSNLGLIKDIRNIQLKKGEHELKFMDVASCINPVTVHIKSLTSPDKFSVLEQNYEYDLLNSQKLLDKFVGKKVKLVDKNYYTGKEEIFNAELLSNNGSPIYKINNEIYINAPGRVILPEVPDNLIANPTLIWLLKNENAKTQRIEASYLTSGINWKADYIVVVGQNNSICDLTGWVTINNNSGTAYNNAKIKLVAGDINRVYDYHDRGDVLKAGMMTKVEAEQSFQEESFFEYHLYTLGRASTIKDKQTKQIELLKAMDVPIEERLIYYGAEYYYRNRQSGEVGSNQEIGVYLEVENSKKNNLGMPLPAGTIRAYKKDKAGSLQFIGEDRIDHTPKNEKIKIKMGDAFDVKATRKQKNFNIINSHVNEQEWQITLRNHKDKAVTVEVIEPIPGDWKILNSSEKYEKTDASTVKFNVKLAKEEIKTLNYRVRIRYW